jgi:hypothetical protein
MDWDSVVSRGVEPFNREVCAIRQWVLIREEAARAKDLQNHDLPINWSAINVYEINFASLVCFGVRWFGCNS